jgi:hypothetical protein
MLNLHILDLVTGETPVSAQADDSSCYDDLKRGMRVGWRGVEPLQLVH